MLAAVYVVRVIADTSNCAAERRMDEPMLDYRTLICAAIICPAARLQSMSVSIRFQKLNPHGEESAIGHSWTATCWCVQHRQTSCKLPGEMRFLSLIIICSHCRSSMSYLVKVLDWLHASSATSCHQLRRIAWRRDKQAFGPTPVVSIVNLHPPPILLGFRLGCVITHMAAGF